MTVVVALLAVVVLLLAVLVAGLLRTNADVLRALDRLGAGLDDAGPTPSTGGTPRRDPHPGAGARTGRPAPDLSGATIDGGVQVVRVAGGEHRTLLLFLSSGCLTCRDFWDALRRPDGLHVPEGTRVVVVARDPSEESPSTLADAAGVGTPTPVSATLVLSSRAWVDYGVPGSPYVALVDGPSGRVVGEGTGGSWAQVGTLLARATDDLRWAGAEVPRARRARRDAAAERDTDDALLDAGLRPGDPRLHPSGRAADAGPEADDRA